MIKEQVCTCHWDLFTRQPFHNFQELDKEFGDDPEETEIPDFDADRFSTKSPELQTRTPSPDDPDEHYEMDIDYQDGNSNDKAETLRIDKTNKGKIYITYLEWQ